MNIAWLDKDQRIHDARTERITECTMCGELTEPGSSYCYHCHPDNCCEECGRSEVGYGPDGTLCHRHGEEKEQCSQ